MQLLLRRSIRCLAPIPFQPILLSSNTSCTKLAAGTGQMSTKFQLSETVSFLRFADGYHSNSIFPVAIPHSYEQLNSSQASLVLTNQALRYNLHITTTVTLNKWNSAKSTPLAPPAPVLALLLIVHDRLPLSDANSTERKADAYGAVLMITGFLAANYSLTPINTQAQAKLRLQL
jgi:hypothetical protein